MVYYGLSLGSGNLEMNPYLNCVISGAVEIPAMILSHICMQRVGRRWSLSVALTLGGLSLLATMVVPKGRKFHLF